MARKHDKESEACIAAMTELGMLYRGGESDRVDFPRIRRAVRAYNERCGLLLPTATQVAEASCAP